MTLAATAPFRCRQTRRSTTPWFVFALLVVGWICANRPQPLAYAVADWAKNTLRFSHHQRLVNDVRAVLNRTTQPETTSPPAALAAAEASAPAAASIPENTIHRRPEWALEDSLSVAPPAESTARFVRHAPRVPVSVVADVPHPPPRAPSAA